MPTGLSAVPYEVTVPNVKCCPSMVHPREVKFRGPMWFVCIELGDGKVKTGGKTICIYSNKELRCPLIWNTSAMTENFVQESLFGECQTRGKKDFLFLNMETEEAITENKVGFLESQPPVLFTGESQWNPFIASESWPQGRLTLETQHRAHVLWSLLTASQTEEINRGLGF